MGAVTERLLRENRALTDLLLEAVGRLDDETYTARVIEVVRGPESAADYLACRGEYEHRRTRPGPARRRARRKTRV